MPPNRELVFCHSCEDEWYRDEHGLVCPVCGSEFVEIIDPEADPRREHESPSQQDPFDQNIPDPDEDDISDATFRSATRPPPRQGPALHPFETLFGSLLGGGGQSASFPPRTTGFNADTNTRETGNTWSTSGSYSFSMSSGPNGVRITRSTGFPPPGTLGGPNDDLSGILQHLMRFANPGNTDLPPGNMHPGQPPFLSPLMGILMGPLHGGNLGDVAYTQESFDRILTMLRDQHGGAEGPPPATEEAIAALPKVKISKEHLDEQNKAECSICMDPVNIGEEVTMLPCNHWFHGDCIKSWLIEHDTCPQCRRGITPRDGNQNQPRTTGQAPRNWQVNEGDIENILGRDNNNVPGGAPESNQAQSSRNRSARPGVVATVASNIMRRFGGSGSNHNNNNTGNNTNENPGGGETRS